MQILYTKSMVEKCKTEAVFYFRPAESSQQWSWDDAICSCRQYTVHFKQMELRSHFLHWAITFILWTSLFEWSILSNDAAQSVAEHVHSKLKSPLNLFCTLFSLATLFECICLSLYDCRVNNVLCWLHFQPYVTLLDKHLYIFNEWLIYISVSECDGNTVKFCVLMLNLVLGQLDYLRNKKCFCENVSNMLISYLLNAKIWD